jgi:hypothetical protein
MAWGLMCLRSIDMSKEIAMIAQKAICVSS